MFRTETHQYRILRIGAGLAMIFTLSMLLWLGWRAWPIVQQAMWPAKLGCGCQVVAMAIPPVTGMTAGLVLAAAALMLGRGAYFFARHIRRSRRLIDDWTVAGRRSVYQHGIQENIIVLTRSGYQAMTMGMFRPRVYITADLLQSLRGSELIAVLRHEQVHHHRYDQLWSAALDSFSAAWWRWPLLQGWVAASLTLRELSADARATGDYQRTDGLSGAILKLAGTRPAADMIAFSPNQDRVRKLLDRTWRPKLRLWRWSYAWALGLAGLTIGLVVYLTPTATATVPPAVARVCRETRLLCRRVDDIPFTLIYRSYLPQSVYVLPAPAH